MNHLHEAQYDRQERLRLRRQYADNQKIGHLIHSPNTCLMHNCQTRVSKVKTCVVSSLEITKAMYDHLPQGAMSLKDLKICAYK